MEKKLSKKEIIDKLRIDEHYYGKFGKQWLDNFIEDPDLQNTFITSEVVRNVLMLQCVFYASVYNDLLLYKQAFLL